PAAALPRDRRTRPLVRPRTRGARRAGRPAAGQSERRRSAAPDRRALRDHRSQAGESGQAPVDRFPRRRRRVAWTAQRMTTLWSGRFDSAPDAAALEFGSSFRFDKRLFEDDVTGSLAWARALAGAGVLSATEARDIEAALGEMLARGRTDPGWVDGSDEDVHSFVERVLVERLGDAGRRLHTGRSRNEQVSLDLRLYLRRRIPVLQRAVAEVVDALARQADAAGDALMPSFTHFRPAQPVLVAHFLLSHAAPLRRDFDRLAVASN